MTFDEVLDLAKRSETAIYAIGLRGCAGCAVRGFREAEFVLKTTGARNRRAIVFPSDRRRPRGCLRADRRRARAASTRLATLQAIRERDGAWRPHRRAGDPAEPDDAHQTGVLRPDRAPVNLLPLLLYAAAAVAYAAHFARREATVGRAATTLLLAGRPRPHLRHRHADDGGRPRAVSRTPRVPSRRSSGC